MRRSRFVLCSLVIPLSFAIPACTAHTSSSTATTATTESASRPCGLRGAGPCEPTSTTTTPTSACREFTTEFLTEAFGRTVTAAGVDTSGCTFTAGELSLTIGPTIGGATPSQYRITNDRSGHWFAEGVVSVGPSAYQWSIVSFGRGSDTYPPTDGPEQQPIVRAAAAAFVTATANLQPHS